MRLSFLLSFTARATGFATAAKYVIGDNDWSGSASFIPPFIYLNTGYEVCPFPNHAYRRFSESQLALETLSCIGKHCMLSGFLEIGDLTSIPVVLGAELLLRNTYERMQIWQQLYGKLA